MASIIVLVTVLLVLSVPFVPLLIELHRPTDTAALPIPDAAFDDARAFALRWIALLREAVDPRAPAMKSSKAPDDLKIRERIDIRHGDADAYVFYATHSISVGRNAHAAYAFAERHIQLRAGARLSHFAYARHVEARDAILDGTVSARALHLRGECRFTRIGGLPITLGTGRPGEDPPGAPRTRRPMTDFVFDRRHRFGDTRFRVRGDLAMPGHTESEADLVVEGAFYLGEASVLRGSVRAHTVEVARRAVIQGAVFARSDIVLHECSGIEGVVCAGRTLHVHRASIGRRGHAVTAYAREIVVRQGASVHGELIAGDGGRLSESCQ